MSFVLFAEDDETIRDGLQAALESEGHETRACADGALCVGFRWLCVGTKPARARTEPKPWRPSTSGGRTCSCST